METGK
jgi:pentatricopeptide repeat protein